MPFTASRRFRRAPRMFSGAGGMYYTSQDGRKVLDGTAGLWCCNVGHGRKEIAEAVHAQLLELDFAPTFQFGHPGPFELAARLSRMMPPPLNHVFFCNGGSDAVDSALKMARAYHHARGEAGRFRLIGRERGYHGTNFGGLSVGGIGPNRKAFGPLVGGVDHLRHTHDPVRNAFSRGLPANGEELADDLLRLIQLHDASTIAAVIIEPVAGSTGVLPPPRNYLQRLRKICSDHGILLIFDEVITGFGRLGTPFAVDYFDVRPDIVTLAKGITNGVLPMGAIMCSEEIHNAFMQGPDHMIEFFHGYTYSGHPVAAAAALATLDIFEKERLLTRAAGLDGVWSERLHALKGLPHIIDIRNIGLIGAIDLEPVAGMPGKRAYEAMVGAFNADLLIRVTGDTIALSPPLIISEDEIALLFDTLEGVLKQLA